MTTRNFLKSITALIAVLMAGIFIRQPKLKRVRVEKFSDLRKGMKFKTDQGIVELIEIPRGDFEFEGEKIPNRFGHLAITKNPKGDAELACFGGCFDHYTPEKLEFYA